MSGDEQGPTGPDLTKGVPAGDVPEGGKLVGHVGEDDVLVARVGGELFAIGAHCTHYHGPLGDGLLVGETVRCPWHHAHFCLRTGEALAGPAIDPAGHWEVREDGGQIVVSAPAQPPKPAAKAGKGPRRVLIAGGGAAGFAAAEMLRRRGFDGAVTMVSADADAPYDRPNCSKDYLAGEAPAEWMPLRGDDWYAGQDIDLKLNTEIAALDLGARTAALKGGGSLGFDAVVLALGAEPLRLPLPGFDGQGAHVLRSMADAKAIIAAADGARRAVIVGASFIGLEVAAALRHRGLEVHVAAPETIPLARVLGDALGEAVRKLHEANGVVFHLGCGVKGWRDGRLGLDDGTQIEANFLVVGAGVRPRTALAEAAGLKVDRGVVVDRALSAAPGVYAVGDIARYPDPISGQAVRVEHWVHAVRQGQHAARAILGDDAPFKDAPFFWSAHYGTTINYVGHAEAFDTPSVEGSIEGQDAEVRFVHQGRTLALATVGRDVASLKAGVALESAGAA
ncbi:MAG TPA: FAD-dependent oxidoreductase [Caulobacteraceae bacterium]|jgi:NADPH-dependent 2,4-dienoyl-CoA reductase/sulfur reductase-like enzyme/nitrite reductase/ring-hydroxylating ferredoxin subunit